jgi:integrase
MRDKGSSSPEQFEAVRRHLPEPLRPVVTFAYITGWRIRSEVLTLRWSQVDFQHGWVRLEPGITKNKQGRMFPLTPELRAILEAQRQHTDTLQKSGTIIPDLLPDSGPVKVTELGRPPG